MISSRSGCCQAETPLIPMFGFPEPALSSIGCATKTPAVGCTADTLSVTRLGRSSNDTSRCPFVKRGKVRLHPGPRLVVEIDHVAGGIVTDRQVAAGVRASQRHVFEVQDRLEEGCDRVIIAAGGKYLQIGVQCHRRSEVAGSVQTLDAALLCSRRVDVAEVPV